MRNVVIEWDECYTSDVDAFDLLIQAFVVRGYKVHLVSMREVLANNRKIMKHKLATVHLTNGQPYEPYLKVQGITPDVWIIARPESINPKK